MLTELEKGIDKQMWIFNMKLENIKKNLSDWRIQ